VSSAELTEWIAFHEYETEQHAKQQQAGARGGV